LRLYFRGLKGGKIALPIEGRRGYGGCQKLLPILAF
jgi:hypothetical protein